MKMPLVVAFLPQLNITVSQKVSASLLGRLRANCASTKMSHLIGGTGSLYYDNRGDMEDVHHVFLTCPQYANEKKTLRDADSGAG